MERVLCAAIWINDGKAYCHQPKNIPSGFVLSGWRHGPILEQMRAMNYKIKACKQAQGFLTSSNRFLDRVEARSFVLSAKQLDNTKFDDELYSEDLY